jgi:glutathione S-transferase
MSKPTLIIGNKKYSSWSLRPWLLMKQLGVEFTELRIPLFQEQHVPQLSALSPTGKVPVLQHDGLTVWDSLAICEFVSEQWLGGTGWPVDRHQRAKARAVAAEMHSGFTGLRSQWPMNVSYRKQQPVTPAIAKDLARIEVLWRECLAASDGPFLFGRFSIADAMYAPVVLRLWSYQPAVHPTCQDYMEALLALSVLQEWIEAGQAETEVIEEDEYEWLMAQQ